MKRTNCWSTCNLWWVLVLIMIVLPQQTRANIILPAANNATVQSGGPRLGVNGKQFFNMEGSANGTFASFGVVDFQSNPLNAQVTSLTLVLTQANAAFTHDGGLIFLLSMDTATNIEPVTSPLIYSAADTPTGLDAQLGPIFLLGAASFAQVSDGTGDVFSFSPSAAILSYLDTQIAAGGRIRLVIAPGDSTVAATYAGFSNAEFSGPELTLVTPVPEPGTRGAASLAILAIAAGVARTRRLRASSLRAYSLGTRAERALFRQSTLRGI